MTQEKHSDINEQTHRLNQAGAEIPLHLQIDQLSSAQLKECREQMGDYDHQPEVTPFY